MAMSKIKAGLSIILVGGAAVIIFIQYQTRQRLLADNDSLRQQIGELKSENEDASAVDSKPTSSDDFNELLRLRGEITALRAQTNQIARLQRQNQQLQDSVAAAAQARQQSAAQSEDERAYGIVQINTSKQAVLAMILYAGDHQDQFPTNFDQAGPYLGNPGVATNINHFEIVYHGPYSNLANPSSAVVVRSIQPWMSNGKWAKAYGFGDGHAEVHSDPNGNFDEWEQQHVPVLKNQ
jgi:hypothetical protein